MPLLKEQDSGAERLSFCETKKQSHQLDPPEHERRVHLKITQWKRENHLNQTSIPGFNFCNLPGCNSKFMDSKMLVNMEPTFRQTFFSETFSWCPALASSRHGDKDMNKREETLAQNLGLFRMLSTTDKCPQSPTFRRVFLVNRN